MARQADPRTRRAGGARRESVLDDVVAVIAELGFAGTRFVDVSARSGVAVSTLQGYFGSRDDMLIEAMRRATSSAVADMEDYAAQVSDPWEVLVAMVDRGLDTPITTWRMLMEFWTAAAHDAELRDHAAALAVQYRAPFRAAIERGVERGEFRLIGATDAVVEVIVAAIVGVLHPVVLGQLDLARVGYREVAIAQIAFAVGRRPR